MKNPALPWTYLSGPCPSLPLWYTPQVSICKEGLTVNILYDIWGDICICIVLGNLVGIKYPCLGERPLLPG